MPKSGKRERDLTYKNNGYYGNYWSSTPLGLQTTSSILRFGSTILSASTYVDTRSNGQAVRCMKNTTQYTVTFHPNNSTSNTTQSVIG